MYRLLLLLSLLLVSQWQRMQSLTARRITKLLSAQACSEAWARSRLALQPQRPHMSRTAPAYTCIYIYIHIHNMYVYIHE